MKISRIRKGEQQQFYNFWRAFGSQSVKYYGCCEVNINTYKTGVMRPFSHWTQRRCVLSGIRWLEKATTATAHPSDPVHDQSAVNNKSRINPPPLYGNTTFPTLLMTERYWRRTEKEKRKTDVSALWFLVPSYLLVPRFSSWRSRALKTFWTESLVHFTCCPNRSTGKSNSLGSLKKHNWRLRISNLEKLPRRRASQSKTGGLSWTQRQAGASTGVFV